MTVTLQEISKELGLSRAAVSHVVNGRAHEVSSQTRERILEALQRHDYQPNALVRSLQQKKTHVISVIVPSISISFYPDMINAIEREAQRMGYQCFLAQSHSIDALQDKIISTMREYRVDGILICPSCSSDQKEMLYRLWQHKTPVVLMDNPVEGLPLPCIRIDDERAGYLATKHLLDLGHRRIVHIRGIEDEAVVNANARLRGYRQALSEAGIEPDDSLVVHGHRLPSTTLPSLEELLDQQVPFTAIFAYNDTYAIEAMRSLRRRGIQMPQEVSLVGCGNLAIGKLLDPTLTSIHQQPQQIGYEAMRQLNQRINDTEFVLASKLMEPELIIRQSTMRRES